MRVRLESHDQREYPALSMIPAEDREAFVTACAIQDSCGAALTRSAEAGCVLPSAPSCLFNGESSAADTAKSRPQGYTVRDCAERIAVAEEVDRIFAQSYLAAILEEQHGIKDFASSEED